MVRLLAMILLRLRTATQQTLNQLVNSRRKKNRISPHLETDFLGLGIIISITNSKKTLIKYPWVKIWLDIVFSTEFTLHNYHTC